MSINYSPLWITMKEKNISTYTLIQEYKISKNLIHRLKHNEVITTYTLDKLCNIIGCTPMDIIEYKIVDEE